MYAYRKGVRTMVANQFPLKSSEFAIGSPQYNAYISVLDQLLNALIASESMELLEVVVNIMCREKEHSYEDQIQTCLRNFGQR